ncbi:carbohydrate ABC transporter permease [Tranquillimonas alkanivorans]|uniref:Carbohydrate ABC transporter membrane protein 2, CUT1 family n=1 Tax=Tranquillimonas alkanivorans TaxID=441119 RepID=A0A1I5VL19_9RHOB|nr:carbohydrate ABC transporter permease [Tranquillimonas alkanivorans]SFQ07686.1 carbohydrate ABC transporter membrane protein 2, CUT1 family [Tranquillimonas alkanivorans]
MKSITGAALWLVRLAYLAFALFPLFWLIRISLTPDDLLYSEGTTIWPSSLTLANFAYVIEESPFPVFFGNTVIVSLGTAAAVTVLAAGIGYAFSRFEFAGKRTLMVFLVITQLFPLVMVITPLYQLLAPIGLVNTRIGLIVVFTAFNLPFAAFLMHSFYEGIPRELEQAAMIDGCTRFQALIRIILPLMLPGIGATLGFVFTAAWSELLFSLMLITSETKKTFAVGLLSFVGKSGVDWGQMMAAATLALIPPAIFFTFIQKYLVGGLTAGAVKA